MMIRNYVMMQQEYQLKMQLVVELKGKSISGEGIMNRVLIRSHLQQDQIVRADKPLTLKIIGKACQLLRRKWMLTWTLEYQNNSVLKFQKR